MLDGGERSGNRHGARADQCFDAAAVIHRHGGGALTAFVGCQARARHRDIAVNGYRCAAVLPDRDKGTARQSAHTGLGVHRQKSCSQRAVDCIATGRSDFVRGVSGQLRGCGYCNAGH